MTKSQKLKNYILFKPIEWLTKPFMNLIFTKSNISVRTSLNSSLSPILSVLENIKLEFTIILVFLDFICPGKYKTRIHHNIGFLRFYLS